MKKLIRIMMLLTLAASVAWAQPKEPATVAIFLYEGVELLDFSGPGEVFSAAGFKVFTVSVDGQELVSQRFVNIKPAYSVANAPSPDIIVFPGGNSDASANDPKVMAWIKKSEASGSFFVSVCTGAGILAKSGMLNEFKHITTFYGYIPELQKQLPNVKVLEHTRFVDNGNVITTAGVSAGIDGALHLVSRIKGLDVAKGTAHYMEYDKWNPEQGQFDYHNAYIQTLKESLVANEKAAVPALTGKQAPYIGEFKNLALEFKTSGKNKQAIGVLEAGLKIYPNSTSMRNELGTLYKAVGKPAPIDETTFLQRVEEGKVDEALAMFEKDKAAFPEWKLAFSEGKVNDVAYRLLQKNEIDKALKVFLFNTREYPKSGNTFDSLGEGYLKAGKKTEAINSYKKSLELDPANDNAKKVLAELGV